MVMYQSGTMAITRTLNQVLVKNKNNKGTVKEIRTYQPKTR